MRTNKNDSTCKYKIKADEKRGTPFHTYAASDQNRVNIHVVEAVVPLWLPHDNWQLHFFTYAVSVVQVPGVPHVIA